MNAFKYSLLLFALCFSIPLLAQPTPHQRGHPKAAVLPFHDMGGWPDSECGDAPFYAIRYLCQCLTGSPNPKPFPHYSLPSSSSLNFNLKSFANQSVMGRPKAKASAFRPKAKTFAFRWSCPGPQVLDNIDCVYDVKRATLTSTHYAYGLEIREPYTSKHRLYHVTLSVLEAAAREPLQGNGHGIDCDAPFAPLLKYGAKSKP